MRADTTTIASPADATPLFVRTWLPDGEPKGVVQLAHGMAEHSGRYERFAQALTDAGYAVWAHDHRGHGETAGTPQDRGYFADGNGWDAAVEDIHAVGEAARAQHPDLPFFFFGHSMGSLLGRDYVTRYGQHLGGAIFSGTGGDQGLLGAIGERIARLEARIRGRRATSPLMNTLTFGQFNHGFRPTTTKFDWLSRDADEVAKYMADPRCGGVFTAGFFADLLGGVNSLPRLAPLVPVDLPVHFLSGDRDPVGGNGKGVRGVADSFTAAGVRDVTLTLYPQGRHEMLNEINRDEVTADVIEWLDEHLPA